MKTIAASAPGKIIIAGEHAVVYGYPALLAATNKRLSLELSVSGKLPSLSSLKAHNLAHLVKLVKKLPQVDKLKIHSDIPAGSGMGSSAALSVCLAAAWLKATHDQPSQEEINELAYQLEKLQHGTPSGGDNTVSCYGGLLWFRKEIPAVKVFKRLADIPEIKNLYLLDTGKPAESTGEMVAQVADQKKAQPKKIVNAFLGMEAVARGWLELVTTNNQSQVEKLIKDNHSYLMDIGVVSASTQELIQHIERTGGAAKITGAGGKSNHSGMLLVWHPNSKKIKNLSLSKLLLSQKGLILNR